MRKLRLVVDLEYDDSIMHGNDPESRECFFTEVLGADPEDNDTRLILHSNLIGDEVGIVSIVSVNPVA